MSALDRRSRSVGLRRGLVLCERFFALITKHIDTNSAAIATAAR
jgi:hypothetical protein